MIFLFRKREKFKDAARVNDELSRTLACSYLSI
jgi:hypothetical protein